MPFRVRELVQGSGKPDLPLMSVAILTLIFALIW